MESIKVVTIGLPNLLKEVILNAFEKRVSLQMLGNYRNLSEFLTSDHGEELDAIIINMLETDELSKVLYLYPKARLVSIDNSGRDAKLWKLVPDIINLGEVSPEQLVIEILSEIN